MRQYTRDRVLANMQSKLTFYTFFFLLLSGVPDFALPVGVLDPEVLTFGRDEGVVHGPATYAVFVGPGKKMLWVDYPHEKEKSISIFYDLNERHIVQSEEHPRTRFSGLRFESLVQELGLERLDSLRLNFAKKNLYFEGKNQRVNFTLGSHCSSPFHGYIEMENDTAGRKQWSVLVRGQSVHHGDSDCTQMGGASEVVVPVKAAGLTRGWQFKDGTFLLGFDYPMVLLVKAGLDIGLEQDNVVFADFEAVKQLTEDKEAFREWSGMPEQERGSYHLIEAEKILNAYFK